MPDDESPGDDERKGRNRTAFVPTAQINLTDDGLQIRLAKDKLRDLFDQGPDMMLPGQGCISSPGGPSC
jgi:hypothetical protein